MMIIWQYCKFHKKSILLSLIIAAVMFFVLLLFDVKISIILYGYLVCFSVVFVFSIVDILRYKEKHKQLLILIKEVTYTIDNMPVALDQIEEDYQAVINRLFEDKSASHTNQQRKYDEMIDYYTIWAHQIKTPISAMRLILQTEDLSSSIKSELSEELLKIEQYVEMVLCYLKLDGESTDYVFTKCSLDSVIKQAVRKYAPQFIRSKNKLIYQGTNLEVLTDEKWLLFIIEQVLSNALKYTDKGEIKIEAEGSSEAVAVVITDTGVGIAPEDLPRIFERGFTGYNGRADKKSTGIGLYLCRRIAENLGAEISAQSEIGKGTSIKINFNLTKL